MCELSASVSKKYLDMNNELIGDYIILIEYGQTCKSAYWQT